MVVKTSRMASDALGNGSCAKTCGISPRKQRPGAPPPPRQPSSTPLSPPMWPSSRISSSSCLSSSRPAGSVAAPKTRERLSGCIWVAIAAKVKTRSTPSSWRSDHLPAEGELADRRLGLAQEDDEVVLPLGSVQTKKRLRGRRWGWMTPSLTSTWSTSKSSLDSNSAMVVMPSLASR